MNIYLDSQPLATKSLDCHATVHAALEAAKHQLSSTDLMIFGVKCDDQEISPEDLEKVLSMPAARFSRVEFISGHPSEVVLSALRQTRLSLADSFTGVKQASECLSKGRVAEAFGALVRCLSVWGQAHEAVVHGMSLCGIDAERLIISGRPLLDWLQGLAEQLRGLKGAIESRDHVLLGDILQYELDETLQGWEVMLDGIISHVEQGFSSPSSKMPEAAVSP